MAWSGNPSEKSKVNKPEGPAKLSFTTFFRLGFSDQYPNEKSIAKDDLINEPLEKNP